MAKKIVLCLAVIASLLHSATAAVAQMYHYVYKWDETTNTWTLASSKEATIYSERQKHGQFRFSSSGFPGFGRYIPPEAEDPLQVFIKNIVHYFPNPWIDLWISETKLNWDVFKPGRFMAKAFTIGVKSHAPVQILFGSGIISVPTGFDPTTSTAIWGDFTKPADKEHMVESKERIGSLVGDKNKDGTPPDVIDVNWWWYIADEKPDPHFWNPDTEPVPSPGQWKRVEDMNGYVITIRDINVWKYLVFFEDLKVESYDSEGKYFEQFSITVAPTL